MYAHDPQVKAKIRELPIAHVMHDYNLIHVNHIESNSKKTIQKKTIQKEKWFYKQDHEMTLQGERQSRQFAERI